MIRSVVCAAMLAFSGACTPQGNANGLTVSQADDFFPEKWPNKNVTLRLASIEIPAELRMTRSGTRRKLTILRDGVLLEEEVYDVDTNGVRVVRLGSGEQFSPAIPLLEYPMQIGKSFQWSGSVFFATRELKATADVTTERALLDLSTGTVETVLATLTLRLDNGRASPVERKLRFWFAKGEGPVKRDYGNQVREPRKAG